MQHLIDRTVPQFIVRDCGGNPCSGDDLRHRSGAHRHGSRRVELLGIGRRRAGERVPRILETSIPEATWQDPLFPQVDLAIGLRIPHEITTTT